MNKLLTTKAEFNLLATDEAIAALQMSRCKHYEFGDKASKLLSHQIHQFSSSHFITQIATPSGTTVDPLVINEQFRDFYVTLYSSANTADDSLYDSFFQYLVSPCVNSDTASKLEEPITLEEIKEAISEMQSGKCPSPDGFPS